MRARVVQVAELTCLASLTVGFVVSLMEFINDPLELSIRRVVKNTLTGVSMGIGCGFPFAVIQPGEEISSFRLIAASTIGGGVSGSISSVFSSFLEITKEEFVSTNFYSLAIKALEKGSVRASHALAISSLACLYFFYGDEIQVCAEAQIHSCRKDLHELFLRTLGTDVQIMAYLGFSAEPEVSAKFSECFRRNSVKLDLGGVGLRFIPDHFLEKLPWVTSLDLSDNPSLNEISELNHYVQLEELDLRGTAVKSLSSLDRLQNLKILYIPRDLQNVDIPVSLCSLIDPKEVESLMRNWGSDENVYRYLNLKEWSTQGDREAACRRMIVVFRAGSTVLKLAGLGLTSFPDVPWIYQLKKLDLRENPIGSLEGRGSHFETFGHPNGVIEGDLTLSEDYLRCFGSDEEILTLLKLDEWNVGEGTDKARRRILECYRNQSSALCLKRLNLTSLPECLREFDWLTFLDLSINPALEDLSPLISLKSLKRLILDRNRETLGVPEFLKDFKALKVIITPLQIVDSYLDLIEKDPRRHDVRDFFRCSAYSYWMPLLVEGNPSLELDDEMRSDIAEALLFSFESCNDSFLGRMEVVNPLLSGRIITGLKKTLKEGGFWSLAIYVKGLRLMGEVGDNEFIKDVDAWLHRVTNNDVENPIDIWENREKRTLFRQKLIEILELSVRDEVFKSIFKGLVHLSMTSCTDRVVYYFNQMLRDLDLYQTQNIEVEKAVPVFKNYFSLWLVEGVAHQSAEKRNLLEEELEVQLDFLSRLKEFIPIVFPCPKARFAHIYRAEDSEIKQAALQIQVRMQDPDEFVSYLASTPFWQERMLRTSEVKEKLEIIEQQTCESLEKFIEEESSIAKVREYGRFLQREFKKCKRDLCVEATRAALKKDA